jgi:hypothetical protein
VVLVLIVIFVIIIARKFIIISKLVNVSKEYENKTNYIAITSSIQNNTISIKKSFNKDGNFLTETKMYGGTLDDVVTFTSYKYGNDEIGIIQKGDSKQIDDEAISKSNDTISSVYSLFGDKTSEIITKAINSRITTNDYNGKECYLIETNGLTIWVDKDTGLVYRAINGDFGVTEFSYEFDTVNNITKPQI